MLVIWGGGWGAVMADPLEYKKEIIDYYGEFFWLISYFQIIDSSVFLLIFQ